MNWQGFIQEQRQLPYFEKIEQFVSEQRSLGKTVYPLKTRSFRPLIQRLSIK
ncbi:hypothetical protein JCM19241_5950 [Vibrio ishigakensis]|uniref:Uncharacterized protein n=1 Tax=Vibrio ishigakensis TaxID=1481914 RepID=A0A0B8QS34_9VIBR|nr:hypothetical protein JCM19241_5950 [Vibrio ishigakensis]